MSKYKQKVSLRQHLLRAGAVVGLVAAVGGSIWWAQSAKSGKQQIEAKRDDRTQCLPQVSGVINVLVDRTGATTESQLESLRSIFTNIKKSIRKNERLAAYAIDAEPAATPLTLIEACAPVSEQDASALTDNIKRVKQRFDDSFGKPLDDFIATLKRQKTESQSPILEVLQAVSASAPAINTAAGEPRRELVVFSDMLQHSYRASLYKLQATVNVEQFLG